jgi:hypothetical protein
MEGLSAAAAEETRRIVTIYLDPEKTKLLEHPLRDGLAWLR